MPPTRAAFSRKARHGPVFLLPVLPMHAAWVARSLHSDEAHMRKPSTTAPPATRGRKLNPSKTSPPAPQPKPAVTGVDEAHMRKSTATAPSVPLGRKMNPSKTSPQAKTDPPAKASSPVKTSPPEKTSHPAKTNPPAPQPKSAVTAVAMGARHLRKPTKKAPSAKRGRKLKHSTSSAPAT